MEELIRMIKRFDKHKLAQIDILNSKESNTNATKLYRAIIEARILNDDDAAKFLFGKNARKSDSKYTTFKSDFRKRVHNSFLFVNLDVVNLDEYYKVIYEANYRWMVIKNLFISNLSSDAVELAKELLDHAIKNEYIEIAFLIIPHIKTMYANKGDKTKYAYYTKLNQDLREQYDAENKAREYQELLRIEYVNSVAHRPKNAELAKKYFEALKPLMEKYQSNILHLYARELETYTYTAVNNYEGLLDVAERALVFFNSKNFKLKIAINIFLHQKMVALMYLRQYEAATKITEVFLKEREHATFNWFKGIESKMFLLFRMKRYEEAYKIYTETTALPEHKTLDGLNKEIWQLFFVYFHLVHKLGFNVGSSTQLFSKNFNFKKFKNDVPTLEHDKRGMNLILLVIELCFHITQGKSSEIIDIEESIKKQFLRYTDMTDHNYRIALFGRMLLVLAGFLDDDTELKNNLEPLLVLFSQTDNRISETMYRSELIELEDIWTMLLTKLEIKTQLPISSKSLRSVKS